MLGRRNGGAGEEAVRGIVCAKGLARDWVDGMLMGESDVDEGGNGLDWSALLCVFDKIFLTGLVFRVPVKYIKLGVVRSMGRWETRTGGGGQVGKRGELELLVGVAVEWSRELHLSGGLWGLGAGAGWERGGGRAGKRSDDGDFDNRSRDVVILFKLMGGRMGGFFSSFL